MPTPRNRCAEYFEKMGRQPRQISTSRELVSDESERRQNFAGHVHRLREEWRAKGRTDQDFATHVCTPATTVNRWANPETAPIKDREKKVDRFCEPLGIVTESMWEPILRYRQKQSAKPKLGDDLRNEVRSKVLHYLESDQVDEEGLKLLSRLVSSLGSP